MAQVFISYSKRDPHVAQLFASAFGQAGLSCWFDVEIEPDTKWRETIEREIDAADCVVVLWSANSVQSRFVTSEAHRGELNGKLVQVLIQNVRPPIGFDEVQYHDLVNWHGRLSDERWQSLLASVNGVVRGKRSGAAGAAGRESRAANAWRHVSQSLDPTDYRSFISNYPEDSLARLARERLKDLDAWSNVDKRNPETIRQFILTGPFEGLVDVARATIGDAERHQAELFKDQVGREAARRIKAELAAAEKRNQVAAAAKLQSEQQERRAAELKNKSARRAAVLATLAAGSPALLFAAASIALQAEHLFRHATVVTDWGVNLLADEAQRAAVNRGEQFFVDALARVTWNWVVVGVSFGEAFYGLSVCCFGALSWWAYFLDDDSHSDQGERFAIGCMLLLVPAIVLYVFAAIVPAFISVALFIFIGWLLLAFLAIRSLMIVTRAFPNGGALALCVFLIGIAFIDFQDGYSWLNVWNEPR